ncbi:hypothetical protein HHK36_009747 [Tetracentron sinense]|uniref:Band 7 domain-containing protein n=1 Tax=Tetracentron sinense TaxID=13715 RepID=A0A834ZM14_TETSI|nr:hypothetical protein HHK36_009747 [Tetracentron sinense]
MRIELGKITLDKTFEERDIMKSINEAATAWGLKCLRYEIRDISPPPGVRAAMEMQAEAERRKRAQVLDSEGEAEAILARAQATAKGISMLSGAIKTTRGVEAASLRIAEQYIQAFSKIAKERTAMLLPSTASNPASMMAQALTIYESLIGSGSGGGLHEFSRFGPSDNSKVDASTGQAGDGSSTPDADLGKPVFSLQSPKRGEEN